MDLRKQNEKSNALPEIFRPIMWSYNFAKIDIEKDKKIVIVNSINYGTFEHWRWLSRQYEKNIIHDIMSQISASEIRPQALKLASLIFSIPKLNYASRGAK